jgi:hypothetical protein
MQNKTWALAWLLLLAVTACNNKETPNYDQPGGQLQIEIAHTIDNLPLETNQLVYTNEAGNDYLITEVQWFISNLRLIKPNGEHLPLLDEQDVLYIDSDLAETMQIDPEKAIPVGDYIGLAFTFGFDEEANVSNRFVNPPESFMFWPDYLGGGYHYLKLNGKWRNNQAQLASFNFHLGIGQTYDSTATKAQMTNLTECCAPMHCEGYKPPDDNKILPVTGFIHNHFDVVLNTPVQVEKDKAAAFILNMKIENWFKSPHQYDHNQWGGSIMQNQAAMQLGCENGWDVFELNRKQ